MIFCDSTKFQKATGSAEVISAKRKTFATYDPALHGRGEEVVDFRQDHLSGIRIYHISVNGISYALVEGTRLSTPEGVKLIQDIQESSLVHYLVGYGHYGDLDNVEHEAAIAGSRYSGSDSDDPLWIQQKGIGAKLIFLLNLQLPGVAYTPFLASIAASYGIRLVNTDGLAQLASPDEPYQNLYAAGSLPNPRLLALPVSGEITVEESSGIFWQSHSESLDFLLAEGLLVR